VNSLLKGRNNVSKRVFFLLCMVFFVTASNPLWARIWNKQALTIPTTPSESYYCGQTPSLALLYGVQPIVSNYNTSQSGSTIHKTFSGWGYSDTGALNGFIALDSSNHIVANGAPISVGVNGELYSSNGLTPTIYKGGSFVSAGPSFSLSGSGTTASVSADYYGKLYMGSGSILGGLSGNIWSKPNDTLFTTTGELFDTISQVAVSPYGEVAISGYETASGVAKVAWYDYKLSAWTSRSLTLSTSTDYSIALGWDSKGNLAVAYSSGNGPAYRSLVFEYLDLTTDIWTTEVLDASTIETYYMGTAMAFDRFGNPVVVSGSNLFYDPLPEPISILCFGLGFCLIRRFRRVA
jgi:hypothetical protein